MFSPDGRLVVLLGGRQAVLWDPNSGQVVHTLAEHRDSISAVAFSPDSRYLLTGGRDNLAVLWDVETGELVQRLSGHEEFIFRTVFSPDGNFMLTAGYAGEVIFWDAETGTVIQTFTVRPESVDPSNVRFSPDGQYLLIVNEERNPMLWDVTADSNYFGKLRGHAGNVVDAVFSPDGSLFLTASDDNTAILWNTLTGEELFTFDGHERDLTSAAFSADGRLILTGSIDDTAILWDTATGTQLRVFEGHADSVYSVAFSPTGRYVVTGSRDSTAIIWDIESGDIVQRLDRHLGTVRSTEFSPDGRYVLTSADDGTAVLWDVETWENVRVFDGHSGSVRSARFSRDGRYIVSAGWDSKAIVWTVQTGAQLQTLTSDDTFMDAAFSPDGRFVLTGDRGYEAILWNRQTGERIETFDGHTDDVNSVDVSPDGDAIITASSDNTVIVTSSNIQYFTGQENPQALITFACKNLVTRDFTEEERETYDIAGERAVCDPLPEDAAQEPPSQLLAAPEPAQLGSNRGAITPQNGEIWQYAGSAGETLLLDVQSEWDSTLALLHNGDVIASNDDTFYDLNAALRFVLPEDGLYEIVVGSYGNESGGDYTLIVTFVPDLPPIAPQLEATQSDDETSAAPVGQPQVRVIAANTVNVRNGPGTEFGIVGALEPETVVPLLEENEDSTWFNVRLPEGGEGWIASFLVERVDNSSLP
jgi:WD40 repeat protein